MSDDGENARLGVAATCVYLGTLTTSIYVIEAETQLYHSPIATVELIIIYNPYN